MPKPKQRRWTCPHCGQGKLAPGRPRKDDVRRYCLPCSEKTGRLVERTCAANEKARKVSKAKSQTKASRKKRAETAKLKRNAAAREARFFIGDLDLRKEWERLCNLACVKTALAREYPRMTGPPTMELKRTTRRSSWGYAHSSWAQVNIYVYRGATDATRPRIVLVHELAHLMTPDGADQGKGRARPHGPTFKRTLIALMRAAFRGIELDDAVMDGYVNSRKAYDLDRYLTKRLAAMQGRKEGASAR